MMPWTAQDLNQRKDSRRTLNNYQVYLRYGEASCFAQRGRWPEAIAVSHEILDFPRFDGSTRYVEVARSLGNVVGHWQKSTDAADFKSEIEMAREQSLKWLSKAVTENNFSNRKYLEVQPEFESLRSLPGYADVIGKLD